MSHQGFGQKLAESIASPQEKPSGEKGYHALFKELQSLLNDEDLRSHLLSHTDAVTGLPNRKQFVEDFNAGHIGRNGNDCLVLVAIADARHFGEVLRVLGHGFSESFVRTAFDKVIGMVGSDAVCYHVSVLSIAFFCKQEKDGAPPAIIEEIVKTFRKPILCNGIPINARVGVGAVGNGNLSQNADKMLRECFSAAQDSRITAEGWGWYNPTSDEAHSRTFRLLTDLPAALAAEGQLELHFQPRVKLNSGHCTSAEALLRWKHPELGFISPAEFIPLVETTALITPVTDWVMRRAARTLQGMGKGLKDFRLSINVSPRNVDEPDFIANTLDIFGTHNIDPKLIELEFTEGCLSSSTAAMNTAIKALKTHGFELAIDDFGTGYSNMSALHHVPARTLKIDRSFVMKLDESRKNELLVSAIINLAHSFEFEVVAEGIETKEAYLKLAKWGCEEGQGYFISRPMPEAGFKDWLGSEEAKSHFQLF